MNTNQIITQTLQRWSDRAKAQGLKPGSVKYARARMEFLVGANTAATIMDPAQGVWGLLVLASIGCPTKDLYPKDASDA